MNFAKLFFFFFFSFVCFCSWTSTQRLFNELQKKKKRKKKNSQPAYRFNITERVETYIWRDTHTKKKKKKREVFASVLLRMPALRVVFPFFSVE